MLAHAGLGAQPRIAQTAERAFSSARCRCAIAKQSKQVTTTCREASRPLHTDLLTLQPYGGSHRAVSGAVKHLFTVVKTAVPERGHARHSFSDAYVGCSAMIPPAKDKVAAAVRFIHASGGHDHEFFGLHLALAHFSLSFCGSQPPALTRRPCGRSPREGPLLRASRLRVAHGGLATWPAAPAAPVVLSPRAASCLPGHGTAKLKRRECSRCKGQRVPPQRPDLARRRIQISSTSIAWC